jgi:hypothetical protein
MTRGTSHLGAEKLHAIRLKQLKIINSFGLRDLDGLQIRLALESFTVQLGVVPSISIPIIMFRHG